MKKYLLFAVAPIAATSLSAQLDINVGPLSPTSPFSAFEGLVQGAYDAQTDLGGAGINNNAMTQFKFAFDSFSITTGYENPAFVRNTVGESTGAGQIVFNRLDLNKDFFRATGDFQIGFFGFDAGATNTIGIEQSPLDGVTNTWELFKYNQSPDPDVAPPPSFYGGGIGNSLDELFAFFHTSDSPRYGEFGPSTQGNENFWRIYEADGFSADLPEGALYALLLDDIWPNERDWDDAFILISGQITAVPEPSVVALLALAGLGGIIYFRRRNSRKAS